MVFELFFFHVCIENVYAFLEMYLSKVSILLKSSHCVKGTIMDTLCTKMLRDVVPQLKMFVC